MTDEGNGFADINSLSAEQVQSEIDDHMGPRGAATTNKAYWNRSHPDNKKVCDRVASLYHRQSEIEEGTQRATASNGKDTTADLTDREAEKIELARVECEAMLKDGWGEQFEENMALAEHAYGELLDNTEIVGDDRAAIAKIISQHGNDATVCRLFYRLGKALAAKAAEQEGEE